MNFMYLLFLHTILFHMRNTIESPVLTPENEFHSVNGTIFTVNNQYNKEINNLINMKIFIKNIINKGVILFVVYFSFTTG